MKKSIWIFLVVALIATGLVLFSFAQSSGVKRSDAIRIVAEKVCFKMEPPLESFPPEEQYEILSNGLAAMGVNNFVGTDSNETMTVGDMKEIFDAASGGEKVAYDADRAECPRLIGAIFAKNTEEKISVADFGTIAGCMPYCDIATVETYIAPARGYLPPGPKETPENPATEI